MSELPGKCLRPQTIVQFQLGLSHTINKAFNTLIKHHHVYLKRHYMPF